jgi:hypothetical protein
MANLTLPEIIRAHGPEAALNLATAYEAVILASSGGHLDQMPDRRTRLLFVEAMLHEGRHHGFETTRLASAALAAASLEA